MRSLVRLFASARDRAGRSEVEVDLPDDATVADLRPALLRAAPGLAPLLGSIRFAVDREYADDARPIAVGAELAAIPPVSGGGA